MAKLVVLYFVKGGYLIGQGFYWGCCLFVSGSIWYGGWQHLSLVPTDGHQWQFPKLGSSPDFGEEIGGVDALVGWDVYVRLQLCVLSCFAHVLVEFLDFSFAFGRGFPLSQCRPEHVVLLVHKGIGEQEQL